MEHTVSAVLGIVTALLIALAVGVQYSYLASSTVGGLTAVGLSFLAGVALISAIGTYVVEDRSPFNRELGKWR